MVSRTALLLEEVLDPSAQGRQVRLCSAICQVDNAAMDACYFSDELSYPIEPQDGRKRVWRRKGERFAPGCVTTVRDKRLVMIWGDMSLHGKSQLVVVNANMDANFICLFPFHNRF